MAHGRNLREVGSRIETLLTEIRSGANDSLSVRTEELVGLLTEVYGAGLERIVEIVSEEPAGDEVLTHLVEDELVASLFLLHDLHPIDVETRIERALNKVRPYLGSHAGGVDFLGVDDEGIVHLRLEGSCHGCPSSTITVKLAIERAIEEAAPEVMGFAVEGVVEQTPRQVISLDSLRRNGSAPPDGPSGNWIAVDGLSALGSGTVTPVHVEGVPVVVCRLDDAFFAYQNQCPACGGTWTSDGLVGQVLTCVACGERFDVQRAGGSLNGRTLHLNPLPLLAANGVVRIAIAEAVA